VTQTDGAIGYVEYAYAIAEQMSYTLLVNKDGKAVSPSADSLAAAAANLMGARTGLLPDSNGPRRVPRAGPSPARSFILCTPRRRTSLPRPKR